MMTKRQQNGFSLLELLVAITISMVAVVAATEMYSTTRQTRRIQAMQAPLTDQGRFAIAMIQRIVSQAGFRNDTKSVVTADSFVAATNGMTVTFIPDGQNQIVCNGTVPAKDAPQSLVIQRVGNSLVCATNGTSVPWIVPATAGTGNSAEVVGFGVKFGIDTSPASTPETLGCGPAAGGFKPGDCIADAYVDALPTGIPRDRVVAARICLVLRSEAVDASVTKPAAVKDCANTDITNSQNDHKLYRTFRTTVLLKNR